MQDPYAAIPGCTGMKNRFVTRLVSREPAVILNFPKENKTRTNNSGGDNSPALGLPIAKQLGLTRVWRHVVDFGDPKSSGLGDRWGYKRVSVPRVSILDGPDPEDDQQLE